MALATQRVLSANPTSLLPPMTHAHQQGLRIMVSQLQATGQDVRLLSALAESLPVLRAGLCAADRQPLEDLDANELLISGALSGLFAATARVAAIYGSSDQPLHMATLLLDSDLLEELAEAARALAEAANDVALRATERVAML